MCYAHRMLEMMWILENDTKKQLWIERGKKNHSEVFPLQQ